MEATLAQRAVVPLGIATGVVGLGTLLLSIAALAAPMQGWTVARRGPSRAESNRRPLHHMLPVLAHGAVLIVAASPLAFLLAPLASTHTILELSMVTATIAAALALLMYVVPPWRRTAVPWLFFVTALILSLDVLTGCRLVARSALSGYAVAGIRFYGLGNEYMGVLVGTAILGGLAFEPALRRFRWLQAGFFLALLLLIGSPLHGADLGGALTAAVGFGVTLAAAARPRHRLRIAGLMAVCLVMTAGLFLTWDALRPSGSRSHIGDFARLVAGGGWSAAGSLLVGKAQMALRLAGSGYALLPLAGVAPLLVLWYYGTGRWLQLLLARRPEVRTASYGAFAASWAALLFNDSGIAPWMFITVALLVLLIDEQLRERM
jgi:hypothetical protein